jgi:F-type H+-transporting ATPase subunit epsilon
MADSQLGGTLTLAVVTHERTVLETECSAVSIPAVGGYVTLLPGHTPLVSTLGIGELSFQSGGAKQSLAIAGGFFEISDDRVTVLADAAERPGEIDVEQAKKDAEEARAALSSSSGQGVTDARHRIQHAEARIHVAGLG